MVAPGALVRAARQRHRHVPRVRARVQRQQVTRADAERRCDCRAGCQRTRDPPERRCCLNTQHCYATNMSACADHLIPTQIAMHRYKHHAGGATDGSSSFLNSICHAHAYLSAPGDGLQSVQLLRCQHRTALPPQAAARVRCPAPMQRAQQHPRRLPSLACPGYTGRESMTCHHYVRQMKMCDYPVHCTRLILHWMPETS